VEPVDVARRRRGEALLGQNEGGIALRSDEKLEHELNDKDHPHDSEHKK
jgi:hypothetical protein